jgi:hypothetical protein
VIGLINITSLWFINNRFGVQWQIKQLQVFPAPKYDTFMISSDTNSAKNSDRSRSRSPRGQDSSDRDEE